MRYRVFGKTGWRVSAVSMGCWGISGEYGAVAEKDVLDAVAAAFDMGVNLFDTANVYGMGVSESLLGKALVGRRDRALVVTKLGHWGKHFADPFPYNSIWSVISNCHASLHRLRSDVIDVYLCHVQKPDRPEIFVEAFERLKQEGKIRQYGISTDDLGALKAINASGAAAVCQINYSILDRQAERELLPYCLENDIGVMIRGPLGRALLTGKFRPDTVYEDPVRSLWNLEGEFREKYLRDVQKIDPLRSLGRPGRSMAQAAIQFTLAHPAVSCPIPGMKNPRQAQENAAAADGELSSEDITLIDSISPRMGQYSAYNA